MGGDPRYPFPKKVWSPAGGWWKAVPNPVGRAIMVLGVVAVGTFPLCVVAQNSTRRYYNWPDPERLGNAAYKTQIGEPPAVSED
mmetsp:Transcript_1567/g.2219  ORF Transcript_1567/g.2219 Transcript_1567/m.2219 type:complete len:84 (+) Transcript_1567:49-300(+)